jgi:hypothetical protein
MQVSYTAASETLSSMGRHRRSQSATVDPFSKAIPVISRAPALAPTEGLGKNEIPLDWGSLGLWQAWVGGEGTGCGTGWVGVDK